MRLLHIDRSGSLTLTKDFSGQVPPYAILSHTWGRDEDEVTFDDITKDQPYQHKAGYAKIEFCTRQIKRHGLSHFWVDTCCINKADFTELQTAISSMFRWYRESQRCYVYLTDVPNLKRPFEEVARTVPAPGFASSRWFTRGWTLQELIAPNVVEFYSRESKFIGTKDVMADDISRITGIPASALQNQKDVLDFSAAERMSWVKNRNTTKPQDKIYCMFGLFDVSTFVNYAESQNDALSRLKDLITARYRMRALAGLEDNFTEQATTSRFIDRRTTLRSEADTEQSDPDLLASLKFEQMDSRHTSIRKEHRTTCSWILNHPLYIGWMDATSLKQHRGLLWIRGHPGCGKSTIMKFICARNKPTKRQSQTEVMICFFFNARGGQLEHTTLGMYRSLLFQLISAAPELCTLLDRFEQDQEWTVDQLCEILADAFMSIHGRRIKCFIDALDECDADEIREMLLFYQDLGKRALLQNVHLLICFASRHYPTFDVSYGLRLTLDQEEGHRQDVITYINDRLETGKASDADGIHSRVFEKSNGIFMWVVLVVDMLNKEYERGYLAAVEKRFSEIPQRLSDLFKNIFQRDRDDLNAFRLCLQWILFASRPLKPKEFYAAMIAGLDPDCVSDWPSRKIDNASVRKFVSSSSKGLAEIAQSGKESAVQFIHETVRDFLLKDGGLLDIFSSRLEIDNLRAQCHDRLKDCCEAYLASEVPDSVFAKMAATKAKAEGAKRLRAQVVDSFPFLLYACQNMLHHANESAKVLPQRDFASSIDLKRWTCIINLFEIHDTRRYKQNVSLAYVFAERGHARLIEAINGQVAAMEDSGGRYGFPVCAALINRDRECIRSLLPQLDSESLQHLASSAKREPIDDLFAGEPPSVWMARSYDERTNEIFLTYYNLETVDQHELDKLLFEFCVRGQEKHVRTMLRKGALMKVFKRFEFPPHDFGPARGAPVHPLYAAACRGHLRITQILIERGADVNFATVSSGTALIAASFMGHAKVAQLLIDRGSNVHFSAGHCGPPLYEASRRGFNNIVEMLLDSAADVNDQGDCHQNNALVAASWNGHAEVVRILIDRGADVNARGRWNYTGLYFASSEGHCEIARMLLDKGADVNAMDNNALKVASENGHQEVVQLLIDRGAETNTGEKSGDALYVASKNGHQEIVRLLLDNGADVNVQAGRDGNALQVASKNGHQEVVRLLLDKGANVNVQWGWEGNALQIASMNGHQEVVRLLLHNGADVNAQGGRDGNALQAASVAGHLDVMRILLDKGAKVSAIGRYGTALQAASFRGNEEAMKILLDRGADRDA